MKPFNFVQAPWHKWALAGTLLASLGASMSFNPESKYIARNEYKTQGQYALAVKNAPADGQNASQDPNTAQPAAGSDKPLASKSIAISIDDFTQAVGVWDVTDGKVLYNIEKKPGANADGAEYCLKCATDSPIKSLDLKNSGLTDGLAIEMFIKSDAQKQISKLNSNSDDDSKVAPVKSNFEFSISCTGFGTGRDTDYDGLLSCQHDGLDKAITACKARIDKQQDARDSKRSSSRLSSYEDDSTQYRVCERFAVNYVRTKMAPSIKTALANPDYHDSAISAIEDLTGSDGLLDGMAGESQLQSELAKALVASDARQALAEIRSRDFLDDAKSRCNPYGMTSNSMNMNSCVQNMTNMAGYNGYIQTINGDLSDLSMNGFDMPAVNMVKTMGIVAAPPTGVNFAAVLQNLSNGYTANGNGLDAGGMQTVDASGRSLDGRWATGTPNFPGAPLATSGVNSMGQQNVMNINRPGTAPQNVPAANTFPIMSGTGQTPIIK